MVALECALHFRTRERFFAEAFRVLRPGGRLATADLLPSPGHSESALKTLQNALGKLNDIAVHEKLAVQLAAGGRHAKDRPQEAYAMGLVIGREQRRARACVAAATRAVKKFSGAEPFWH